MSDLLWQKPGVAVDAKIQAFLAGDDVLLDREFFLHDITASTAHAEGMQRIGTPTAEQEAFLDDCFQLQTLALRAMALTDDDAQNREFANSAATRVTELDSLLSDAMALIETPQDAEFLIRRIEAMQAMRRTLQNLLQHCHGDARPDCPILDDLSGSR